MTPSLSWRPWPTSTPDTTRSLVRSSSNLRSALDLVSVTADEPIAYDGLIEQYLPECRFRGRQNGKIQFAVLAAAARRGGVEADLLGEVICGRPMTSGRTPSLLPLP